MKDEIRQVKKGVYYDNYGDMLTASHLKNTSGYQLPQFHMHTTVEVHIIPTPKRSAGRSRRP